MLAWCDRCQSVTTETVISFVNDDNLCEKCSKAEAERLLAAGILKDPDDPDYDPEYDIPDEMYDRQVDYDDEPADGWPPLTTFDEYDRYGGDYY